MKRYLNHESIFTPICLTSGCRNDAVEGTHHCQSCQIAANERVNDSRARIIRRIATILDRAEILPADVMFIQDELSSVWGILTTANVDRIAETAGGK